MSNMLHTLDIWSSSEKCTALDDYDEKGRLCSPYKLNLRCVLKIKTIILFSKRFVTIKQEIYYATNVTMTDVINGKILNLCDWKKQ